MHFKLFHFIFNINYYYGNYIKLLLYRYTHWMAALSTLSSWWLVLLWSDGGVCAALLDGSSSWLWFKFCSTTESSSQVPLKFRLLFNSTTHPRRLPGIMPFHVSLPPCLLDRLDRWLHLMYCSQMYCSQMYCLRRSRLHIYCRRVLTDRTIDWCALRRIELLLHCMLCWTMNIVMWAVSTLGGVREHLPLGSSKGSHGNVIVLAGGVVTKLWVFPLNSHLNYPLNSSPKLLNYFLSLSLHFTHFYTISAHFYYHFLFAWSLRPVQQLDVPSNIGSANHRPPGW